MRIDTAIDDYLRLIVRTRPWTKQHEEEVLMPFGDWLFEQDDLSTALAAITPAVTKRYAQSVGLTADEHDDLDHVVGKLLLWAETRSYVRGNPFTLRAAA